MENFKNFLTEQKSVYIMELLIKAEPTTRLYGRIFEAIRGIEGVTVIRSTEAMRQDTSGNKIMNLSIRFYVSSANTIFYMEQLQNTIRNLKDAEGDRIISVQVNKPPQNVDQFYT